MKAAWLLLALAACEKVGPGIVAEGSSCASPRGERRGALVWSEDDYDQARACAAERKVPLVVDLWAPWCHTCLSMSQYVLTDPAFAPFADRFVFVGIDTDKPSNAAVVAKLPQNVWPTYFVLSPDDETIEARFEGAATVRQWREFLGQGESAYAANDLPEGSPLAHVRNGDRAMVAHDLAAADREYGAALAMAPADWPRRPDVLVSQIGARYKRGEIAGCLELGLAALDQTGRSSSVTDFLVWALRCADEREKDAPERARAMREAAAARLTDITHDPSTPLSVDDRSDALANLRELEDQLGHHDLALAAAEQQRALLDDAANHAPSPAAAGTFNYQRGDVYVYLGRPLDIVPALEASARALPDDYDPPYRLAWVLLKANQPDEAKIWIDHAAQLAYGPRKARVLSLAADIAKARGDHDGEKSLRAAVVAQYESLPPGQVSADTIAKAKSALAALDR
ncbi:MAG TPA: thioredoxin family protein [Kofleriaceae bacterium]|nr:thioredoxin family protein [Kofleriaceae bacterium]